MARTPKGTPPQYPTKPHKGQARITLRISAGKRRDILLGPFGSSESRAHYRRVLAELEANGGQYPHEQNGITAGGLTVSEICLRFWRHAENYYRLADGSPSRELEHYKYALVAFVDLYGSTVASEFGPLKIKAVRQRMIETLQYRVRPIDDPQIGEKWLSENRVRLQQIQEGQWEAQLGKKWLPVEILQERKALCRKVINQRIDHIKRLYKWAVSEELVPATLHQALKTVTGLRRGHPGTYERPKVKPVPWKHVETVLPHLPPQVAAMVQLQTLIGARETEICMIRGRDIDRSGRVWWYRIDPNEVERNGPANLHKTAHHEGADGTARVKMLPIGPKAQVILKPWLRENADEFLFNPLEARQKQNAERRANRKTPLWSSHLEHQARKKKTMPKRKPGDHYTRRSYAQAITRACKRAGIPHWHPHQLKHVCGTQIREAYGAEAAQLYLGHAKLSTAEIYAEKDMSTVERIALEVG